MVKGQGDSRAGPDEVPAEEVAVGVGVDVDEGVMDEGVDAVEAQPQDEETVADPDKVPAKEIAVGVDVDEGVMDEDVMKEGVDTVETQRQQVPVLVHTLPQETSRVVCQQ